VWQNLLHDIKKYVHIKACLARRCIPRAWGQVKMTFIPVHRKADYTNFKGHNPISLLSFMQKTIQKLVTRNIKGQSKKQIPYIYTNLPTNQGSPHKLQCTMWLHLYRTHWKTVSYSSASLDIQRASDSTSQYNKGCQMAWAWRNFSDGLAPCWVTEKLQPHSQEKWKGLWSSAVCRRGFYYPIDVKSGCRRTGRVTQKWLLYTQVCSILISKNSEFNVQLH